MSRKNKDKHVIWVKDFDDVDKHNPDPEFLRGKKIHYDLYSRMKELTADAIHRKVNIAIGSIGIEFEDKKGDRYYLSRILSVKNSSGSDGDTFYDSSSDSDTNSITDSSDDSSADGDNFLEKLILFCSNSRYKLGTNQRGNFHVENKDSFHDIIKLLRVNDLVTGEITMASLQTHGHSEVYYLAYLTTLPNILLDLVCADGKLSQMKKIRTITLDIHSLRDMCSTCQGKFSQIMKLGRDHQIIKTLLGSLDEKIGRKDTIKILTRVSSLVYHLNGGRGEYELPSLKDSVMSSEFLSTNGIVLAWRIER